MRRVFVSRRARLRVRSYLALGLLLVLAVPAASAQLPAVPAPSPVEMTLAPFPAPLTPAKAAQVAEATVRVSCALAAQAPQGGLQVSYHLPTMPKWAQMLVVPPVEIAAVDKCDQGFVVLRPKVVASVTTDAPAFTKGMFVLEALVAPPSGEQRAAVEGAMDVGYFGAITLGARDTALDLAPDQEGTFFVVVTNNGNAKARVSFEATATEGVTLVGPESIVLPSRAQGASAAESQARIQLKVRTDPSDVYISRGDPVTLRANAVSETNPPLSGGSATIALRVNTVGGGPDESAQKDAPVGWLAAPLALGVVALARRARQS